MQHAIIFLIIAVLTVSLPKTVFAIEDPLSVPNNKIGIHILFPEEIEEASRLINSSGGDWGYVTIPIQAGDRDLDKWQTFMNKAKSLHVVPLIRLATEGDYFNTKVWRKPSYDDILDFANFLNSLTWPTKNRYIIVFNEVNRGDEWGGKPDPVEYAQILSYAVNAFKERHPNFFIISAGLDNASATGYANAINQFDYFEYMQYAVPGIYDQIDGISSHSYPNPGFIQPPTSRTTQSITSFSFEQAFIGRFTPKSLPIFITETGWNTNKLSEETVAKYYTYALENIWNDENITAVTPFIFRASAGPFTAFSFLRPDGSHNLLYESIKKLPKIKGEPHVATDSAVLGQQLDLENIPAKDFRGFRFKNSSAAKIPPSIKTIFKWLLKI